MANIEPRKVCRMNSLDYRGLKSFIVEHVLSFICFILCPDKSKNTIRVFIFQIYITITWQKEVFRSNYMLYVFFDCVFFVDYSWLYQEMLQSWRKTLYFNDYCFEGTCVLPLQADNQGFDPTLDWRFYEAYLWIIRVYSCS